MHQAHYLFAMIISLSISCQTREPVDIVADGAELELVADGYQFTEGPAADAAGNVYFTDQPNDRILKWSISGETTTWLQPCGRSNGLCFDADGMLWACADEKNELWRIDQDKNVSVVVDNYEGRRLNGPNDVWLTPDGGLYFSDPFYKRPYWDHDSTEQDCQGVYFLAAPGAELTQVVNDLVQPNGIIGTPDGKLLYVTDIGDKKTYSYDIQDDGTLGEKKLFCAMGSDGMTLDEQGNLYLTGKGVTVFDKAGQRIKHLDVPENWTANVCFGGPDMNDLFITAKKGLYRMKMNVKGVGSQ
jgi:gluconolactonase